MILIFIPATALLKRDTSLNNNRVFWTQSKKQEETGREKDVKKSDLLFKLFLLCPHVSVALPASHSKQAKAKK